MSSESNSSNEDASSLHAEIAMSHIVRFWIILPLYIPSIICSLFIFYHFIVSKALRKALHNHVISLLLFINMIVQLTSFPWILNYYRLGYVWPQNPLFCLTWEFIDEALYITTTLLFAWATIERHILIFHDKLVSTKYKLFLFHYLPVIILLLYSFSYNIIAILIPPCENTFDYTELVCGYPLCYYEVHSVSMWDIIVNDLLPTIIIIFCSIGIILRTLYQKYHMHRAIRWRQHRKMTIQLLAISFLYLFIYIPEMLMEFFYLCGVPEEFGADFMLYEEFFANYGSLLLPFVCTASTPELQKQIKKTKVYLQRPGREVVPRRSAVTRQTLGNL